jgi:hypothetical protein
MSRIRGENSPEPPGSACRQIAHRTLRGGRVSRSNDKIAALVWRLAADARSGSTACGASIWSGGEGEFFATNA